MYNYLFRARAALSRAQPEKISPVRLWIATGVAVVHKDNLCVAVNVVGENTDMLGKV